MIKIFSTRTMYDVPRYKDYFRVGPWIGVCIFVGFGIAIMWRGI